MPLTPKSQAPVIFKNKPKRAVIILTYSIFFDLKFDINFNDKIWPAEKRPPAGAIQAK